MTQRLGIRYTRGEVSDLESHPTPLEWTQVHSLRESLAVWVCLISGCGIVLGCGAVLKALVLVQELGAAGEAGIM